MGGTTILMCNVWWGGDVAGWAEHLWAGSGFVRWACVFLYGSGSSPGIGLEFVAVMYTWTSQVSGVAHRLLLLNMLSLLLSRH